MTWREARRARAARLAIAAIVVAGCGGDGATVARPAPPPPSATMIAVQPAPVVRPRPTSPKPLPPPLPAWLHPDFDERTLPLRTRLARTPEVFGDERNLALNAPVARTTRDTVYPVLEEPKPDAERVHVLCTSYRDRVALFVRRADLALRTRKGAVLAAREDELDGALTTPATFATFVFDAGVDVGITRDVTSKVVRVAHEIGGVAFSGVMFRSQLDEVYEWPVFAGPFRRNAQIPRGAVILDDRRGKPFARLPVQRDGGAYNVETLGAEQQGMQLVRVRLGDGLLTGWVDAARLEKANASTLPRISMGQAGSWAGSNAVDLPKGTLLLLGGEPIGVVKSDARYGCSAGCSDASPTVSLTACHASLTLIARRPPPTEN